MEINAHRLWITWEKQRRNQSMATWLSAELHELSWTGNRLSRYIILCYRTFKLLKQHKPAIVFFQNPSIVLAAFITLLHKLRLINCKTVGDFHNAGVFPPVGAKISQWIARNSDLTIVSNDNLAGVVQGWGGRAVAVPDPLPVIHHNAPANLSTTNDQFDFLFICSWAEDEPIANVVEAAAMTAKEYPFFRVFITGRPKLEKYLSGIDLPPSVTLTGFLSTQDFDTLLCHADVIIDLTTRQDCMVCGAYEAVAAEKPAILSSNEPTRSYFSSGVLFTDNSAADIYRQMISSHENIESKRSEVKTLKLQILEQEKTALDSIKHLLTLR